MSISALQQSATGHGNFCAATSSIRPARGSATAGGLLVCASPRAPCSPVCERAMSTPRRGASPAFVDPKLTAKEALPVWLPETGAAPLHLAAEFVSTAVADFPGVL